MTILIIVGIIVLLGIIFASMYNSLVKLRNNRENAFADIDVQLKQRHDLIPQLVNQNFLQLQEEIADVENKLAAVRRYFNSATKEYNNAVQTFPSNIIAGMTGFQREIMFDLGKNERANLEQAPKISF